MDGGYQDDRHASIYHMRRGSEADDMVRVLPSLKASRKAETYRTLAERTCACTLELEMAACLVWGGGTLDTSA